MARSAALFLLICSTSLSNAAGVDERALAMLRGAEQSRRALRAGEGKLKITAVRGKQSETHAIDFQFREDMRTFFQTSDILVIPPEHASIADRIQVMDPAEKIAKGYAFPKVQEIRTAWAGDVFHLFWKGHPSATTKPVSRGPSNFLFDPRLLGVSTDLSAKTPFGMYFGYQNCKEATVVGRETIRGVETWHLKVLTSIDSRLEYWIEDRADFRVHRVLWDFQKLPLVRIIESVYDPQAPNDVIPKSMAIQEFGARKGEEPKLTSTITVDVERIEFKTPAKEPGTIASLDLPTGTRVDDERTDKVVGYWDGTKIVKDRPTNVASKPESDRPKSEEVGTGGRNLWIGVSALAALLVIVAYAIVKSRRTGREGPT